MAQRWITTKYGARVLIEDMPKSKRRADNLSYKTIKGNYYTGKTFGQMIQIVGKKFLEAERQGQPYSESAQNKIIKRIRDKYSKKK